MGPFDESRTEKAIKNNGAKKSISIIKAKIRSKIRFMDCDL